MQHRSLPKVVQSAINRKALKLAQTDAYRTIKQELEQRARTLMEQPHATIHEVVAVLDSKHYLEGT